MLPFGECQVLFPRSDQILPSIEGADECSSASSESCRDEMEDIGDEEVEWGALLRPPSGQADDRVGLRDDNHDRPRARRSHLISNQSIAPAPKDMQTDSLQSLAIESQVLSLPVRRMWFTRQGSRSREQCKRVSHKMHSCRLKMRMIVHCGVWLSQCKTGLNGRVHHGVRSTTSFGVGCIGI